MERSIAIRKLGKLLGKSLGYRIEPKAPTQDEREAALTQLSASRQLRASLGQQRDARRDEVLKADAEYQRLKQEYEAMAEQCEERDGIVRHYRGTDCPHQGAV